MKLQMRRTVPAVVVAVALGASTTLLVSNAGGDTKDTKPPRAISDCKPPPDPCGSDSLDATVVAAANEAARRMIELQTTGSTTVNNPVATR